MTISNGRERRVTDEQARRLSESLFAACVQIGVGEAIDTSDVAADLLAARAEIATLRAKLAAAVVVYGGDGHYSHDALIKARAANVPRW